MKQFLFLFAILANTAFGDSLTIGPRGIDSKATGLDGRPGLYGYGIGQVEFFRSGKDGYDDAAFSAPNTSPQGVYFGSTGSMDTINGIINGHATEVAGVMIGKAEPNADYEGVAPGAHLHSLAFGSWIDDGTVAVSINSMARFNNQSIRAINLSFGRIRYFYETLGNAHLTQFIDWSARRHDVLYVAAWGNVANDDPLHRTPGDNYNGITVAASGVDTSQMERDTYDRFAPINAEPAFAGTERTHIDILAPGEFVERYTLGGDVVDESGSSFAAAHVTGAVALLLQYQDQQQRALNERFLY